jgi:hypothetical protein
VLLSVLNRWNDFQTYRYSTGAVIAVWEIIKSLAVWTIATVIFTGDLVFGLVAVWALVAIGVKEVAGLDEATAQTSWGIRAAATQSALIIGAFIVITIARNLHERYRYRTTDNFRIRRIHRGRRLVLETKRGSVDRPVAKTSPEERALPLLNEKTLSVDYGTGSV